MTLAHIWMALTDLEEMPLHASGARPACWWSIHDASNRRAAAGHTWHVAVVWHERSYKHKSTLWNISMCSDMDFPAKSCPTTEQNHTEPHWNVNKAMSHTLWTSCQQNNDMFGLLHSWAMSPGLQQAVDCQSHNKGWNIHYIYIYLLIYLSIYFFSFFYIYLHWY